MNELLFCNGCETREGCRSVGRCQLRTISTTEQRYKEALEHIAFGKWSDHESASSIARLALQK